MNENNELFTIRQAIRSDLPAVSALYREAVGSDGCIWNEYYPTIEDAENDLARGGLYVMENENGRIIAATSVVPENELDGLNFWNYQGEHVREAARITVKKEYRGRGLSAVLLGRIFDLLKKDGCEAIRLLAAKCNPAALRTYEKMGFQVLSECEMYGNEYFAEEKIL